MQTIVSVKDGLLKVGDDRVVRLSLASENRQREIGFLHENPLGYLSYYKHDHESQVFRKADAWSVNWALLSYLPRDESTINIRTELFIYRITKKEALERGSFLYFKESGIEKKFYIPRRYFNKEVR